MIASSVTLINIFVWYYVLRAFAVSSVDQSSPSFYAVLDSAIIISAVLGALAAKRTRRVNIFYFWIVMGVISTPVITFLSVTGDVLITALFLGFSFGIGLPSGLSYFADSTTFEKRGMASGILFMTATVGSLLLLSVLVDNFWTSVVASVWRILGLIILLFVRNEAIEQPLKEKTSFRSVLSNKSFLLYVLPWLLFALVDSVEKPYFSSLVTMSGQTAFASFDNWFEPLIGLVSAVIAGFLADRIGRKKIVLYGFIALGLTFAILSLAPTYLVFWYIASAVDGVAWGIFYVMFVFVLWGDISPPGGIREKYYAFGAIPFFLAEIVGKVVEPFAKQVTIQTFYAAFPLASFFLFVAVLALMYAPETLPETRIKEIELKGYVEKAKKTKEKYS